MVRPMGLRDLPKIDHLLATSTVAALLERYPRALVKDAVRRHVEQLRQMERSGVGAAVDFAAIEALLIGALAPSLVPVINATGVLLHTNLGRAPLAPSALAAVAPVVEGYCNLEYDLEAGGRGDRSVHCEALLSRLTGADAALVVNNNAAAMVLALAGLAQGREAIVSRGELIEIGGSFRLPEIFETSGVRLVEVGTTNRTRLADYERAVRPETALLVKAHRSNFEVVGFTEEASGSELVALGARRGLPTLYDLGSGCLVDLAPYGLASPTVQGAVAEGWDLVAFSGDKLLGGPQAGILVGRKAEIQRLARHPLLRALRVDKLAIAVLERTLASYLDGTWRHAVPLFDRLGVSVERLLQRAADLREAVGCGEVVRLEGRMGGGTLPTAAIASAGLRIALDQPDTVASRLRCGRPVVVARVEGGALIVDLRAVGTAELAPLGSALHAALQPAG